jgi:glucose/mannose-6-phosphate isomerase
MLYNPEIDKSNMYDVLKAFPRQFAKGDKLAAHIEIPRPVERALISGMGGSSLIGDIIPTAYHTFISKPFPIEVSRDYRLHPGLDKRTLVFHISFSGNTEETISALEHAMELDCANVVMTSGGQLEQMALDAELPLIKLEKESENFQPRMSVGYMFGAISRVLNICGMMSALRNRLGELEQFLLSCDFESLASEAAEQVSGRIPIIISNPLYGESVARIIKIKFNENAKISSYWNTVPEMNHNEMIGYTHAVGNYAFIFVRDPLAYPRILKRMDIMERLLGEVDGNTVIHLDLLGSNPMQRVFYGILWGDYVSYALAMQAGIDPTPVPMVEEFKKLLENE